MWLYLSRYLSYVYALGWPGLQGLDPLRPPIGNGSPHLIFGGVWLGYIEHEESKNI